VKGKKRERGIIRFFPHHVYKDDRFCVAVRFVIISKKFCLSNRAVHFWANQDFANSGTIVEHLVTASIHQSVIDH
jgi:hypothetical protein